jgi:hypothetical protein
VLPLLLPTTNDQRPPLPFYQKFPPAHDLLAVDPDVEVAAHHVNVCRGIPFGTRVFSVGISECDMYAGKFLILQNLADHVLQLNIRPNRELTDPITVLVGVGIGPEIVTQFLIAALCRRSPNLAHR